MFSYIKSWFASPPVAPEIRSEVQSLIDNNKIMIFLKSYCPYCDSTKNLMNSLAGNYKVIELNNHADGSAMQTVLKELTGQSTVPNIFINKKHIGGNSDLQSLNNAGKLQAMVN